MDFWILHLMKRNLFTYSTWHVICHDPCKALKKWLVYMHMYVCVCVYIYAYVRMCVCVCGHCNAITLE